MSTRTKRRFNPFLLLFSVILAWQIGSPALAQTQSQVDLSGRNVLILHALESNVPVVEFTDRGLRQALTAGGVPVRNQFYEFLDLARNPSPEHRKTMVELMRCRYTGRKVDLVISSYPDALRL